MLTSYALLHMPPRPNRSTCTLAGGGRPGRLTHGAAATPPLQPRPMEMDDLASSTSEQWRLRVGRLWGMPYEEHPPEVLQTADARLVSRSGWPGFFELDAALFAPAERAAAAAWVGKVVTPRRPWPSCSCVEPLRAKRACAIGPALSGACSPAVRPRGAGGTWAVAGVGCWSQVSRVATSPAQAAAGAAVVTCFPYQYALPDFAEGGRCVPRHAVDTVVRRTCRAASAPRGGRGHESQDWWSQRRFGGKLSGATRAATGWGGGGGRTAGRPPAHDAGAEWWSPWDELHATLHQRSTAVPVYHDDHPSVTAANLEETLRASGGRVGGVDACQIPGLACGTVNRTARPEASAGVKYNQLPRSLRRRPGSIGRL